MNEVLNEISSDEGALASDIHSVSVFLVEQSKTTCWNRLPLFLNTLVSQAQEHLRGKNVARAVWIMDHVEEAWGHRRAISEAMARCKEPVVGFSPDQGIIVYEKATKKLIKQFPAVPSKIEFCAMRGMSVFRVEA